MTVTDIEVTIDTGPVELIDAYAAAHHVLGGTVEYQRLRLRAARRFLERHADLDMWMTQPMPQRLADVSSSSSMWPLVTFALISTRVQADAEILLVKGFGHSMRRWVTGLYPTETRLLHSAAGRINISTFQADAFIAEGLAFAIAFTGKTPATLTEADLDRCVTAVRTSTAGTPAIRKNRASKLFGVRKLLFEAGLVDCPPAHRRQGGPLTRQGRLAAIAAPGIRDTLLAYLDARAAVLRPKTIDKLTSALGVFGEFLTNEFPDVVSIDKLERRHIEAFLSWTAIRSCRNHHGDRPVGPFVAAHAAIVLRGFLDDITEWGWPQAPARRLVFPSDIPKQPSMLPRALAPDVDQALMTAVAGLDDLFARVGLTILRGSGLRIGELLELELDAIVDYGPAGSWLRVPLGKLNTERMVPLDAVTLTAFDEWFAHRRQQRALPHPRDQRPTDFVFVEAGRHLGPARIQKGLRDAVREAGLTGPNGAPVRIVAHQLRHTYATSLVNAGMSLQALMNLLGHYAGEKVKSEHQFVSGSFAVESSEEPVEDFLATDLTLVGGVVALALKGGPELDGGLEEGAGLADRLEVAVEPDRPRAVAVAEHSLVHLGAELAHLGALGVGGQFAWRVVEGLDLLGHREVFVGDGAIGDAGIHHGHAH